MSPAPIPVERIERAILFLRGHKIMLDSDLAALYGVETRVLVQAVKRNPERFPKDFMFQLINQEVENWRSQIGDGSSISVERMTITGHARPLPNEGCCPKQYGGWVRAGAAAAQHLPQKAAHGFDGVCGPRQFEMRVREVGTVEGQTFQEFANRCLDTLGAAVAV